MKKYIEMLFGFFIGALLLAEINVHGFIMGIGVTAVFVIVIILIKKYIKSWLSGGFE